MDKGLQDIRSVPQDVVCAAADNHAGFLVCELLDDLQLGQSDIVLGGKTAFVTGQEGIRKPASVNRVLTGFLDIVTIKAGFLGNLLDQLLIITRNAEFLRHFLADGSAAAAELPADRNDFLHTVPSFPFHGIFMP
jgi:hypothetical protein